MTYTDVIRKTKIFCSLLPNRLHGNLMSVWPCIVDDM